MSARPKIFVFGSNLAGRHGKGAALFAARHYGAERGIGEGLTGTAYALPTKSADLSVRTRAEIAESVARFSAFARKRIDLDFYVTPVGTGLAGYTKREIAALFYAEILPENVYFTREWFQPSR